LGLSLMEEKWTHLISELWLDINSLRCDRIIKNTTLPFGNSTPWNFSLSSLCTAQKLWTIHLSQGAPSWAWLELQGHWTKHSYLSLCKWHKEALSMERASKFDFGSHFCVHFVVVSFFSFL
jgi:hypothetical protein